MHRRQLEMIPIFICEDNALQRKRIETIVTDFIATKDYDMKLFLSTDNPVKIVNYLKQHQTQGGIYFLDVDLQHELNGFSLATRIRDIDTLGFIAFITSHVQLSHMTFQHKIEAMDYIVKSSIENITTGIHGCLETAYQRSEKISSQKTEYFNVNVGTEAQMIPHQDIMFFESHYSSHKLILHTTNGFIEFYGTLGDIEKESSDFYRCHQSFVVNLKNIKSVNKMTREVVMVNGEKALVGIKKTNKLIDAWTAACAVTK